MDPFITENRAPRTPDKRNKSWVAEDLWGHRIERQPCQLLLLEFLSMAEAMHRNGKLLQNVTDPADIAYRPYLSTQLRNILFKNPLISEILHDCGDTDEAWNQWFESMKDAQANDEGLKDFRYLKDRFDSFKTFESVVKLLSRISIKEINSNYWNYMRIHPIGPAAYYDERDNKFNIGYTQFTRTGGLAYLMLSRSTKFKAEIKAALEEAFDPAAQKNRLLCKLMRDEKPDLAEGDKPGAYLPYKKHPCYDLLAEDVHALFRLHMPPPDAFQHLAPLLAFHVLIYQLRTASATLSKKHPPTLVCEILAPRNNQVRKAATESLINNESLAIQALEHYCRTLEAQSEEIQRILAEEDPTESSTVEAYKEEFGKLFYIKPSDCPDGITIEEVRSKILSYVQKDYKEKSGDGLRSMADEAGLRSKVKTRQYRFCPSDNFLRIMVLANVTRPLKETVFLSELYRRYGIVIGPEEAGIDGVMDPAHFQKSEFEKNAGRLTNRLVAMGLARRMSDSFTYVINPIAQDHAS
jgi:hypothetical protein